MEESTGHSLEPGQARRHLDAARAALRSLDEMAAPEGATLSGKVVSRQVNLAMTELMGMDAAGAFDANAGAQAPRVACSACGKMIMATATLCGFCWRRQEAPANAAATIRK